MKRMCAWCGMELDRVVRHDQQPLTHGLCPACRKRFFSPVKGPNPSVVQNDREKGRGEQAGLVSS